MKCVIEFEVDREDVGRFLENPKPLQHMLRGAHGKPVQNLIALGKATVAFPRSNPA